MNDSTRETPWEQHRSNATPVITALIPPGHTFILVDQDEWGISSLIPGRRCVPFLERTGEYWGAPADDETAISEFERLRQAGASFIVFARPAFWWLDYYSEWHRHLASQFRCVLANHDMCVFDLLQPPTPGSPVEDLARFLRTELNLDRRRNQQQARHYSPGDLRAFEWRAFSEDGEDGILHEVLQRIGRCSNYFVEFGVGSGRYCNCARLVFEEDWQGLFMEAVPGSFRRLHQRYRSHPKVQCVHAVVTSANIETLLATYNVPRDFDVLSIDIDGNDYWVWAAIKEWRPRVVVIEYNAHFPPPQQWVMEEVPNHQWDGTKYIGASLSSLASLGKDKGYVLVATNSEGVNAFFVRKDLFTDETFLDPTVYY